MYYRLAELVHLDFAPRHRQPNGSAVVVATIVALAGSLIVDAILVALGEALWPGLKGYVHFRFSDYAKLTVIGVLIACAAWPITTRITSMPRWMFVRMAVAVTLVLYLPDLYLLVLGDPGKAVLVLMAMHLAIALVTYNALVRIAPVRTVRTAADRLAALRVPR
ncbi:hypothetical protein GHK86_16705 [Acidimicrobiaceae bacterium USS-CC1]|uniref:Uncharacterized protein n=1 Tax=Acidiferrimicrobium australe TaxID=2664430 RepID=A0ABW9QXE6_9ACTN|nr:hypothetical protein [Acidiferrimicrobium australe]